MTNFGEIIHLSKPGEPQGEAICFDSANNYFTLGEKLNSSELMEDGALLDSTPGASEAGGADLDLRGLEVADWSPIRPFLGQIANVEREPAEDN